MMQEEGTVCVIRVGAVASCAMSQGQILQLPKADRCQDEE